MPSNADLKADIAAIAEANGLTVDVSNMNNATLAATLSGLREQYPAAPADADADAAPEHGVRVKQGKSITSPRGILADGEVLREGDIADEDTVAALVKLGILEKF